MKKVLGGAKVATGIEDEDLHVLSIIHTQTCADPGHSPFSTLAR